jgi:hypothetical protein
MTHSKSQLVAKIVNKFPGFRETTVSLLFSQLLIPCTTILILILSSCFLFVFEVTSLRFSNKMYRHDVNVLLSRRESNLIIVQNKMKDCDFVYFNVKLNVTTKCNVVQYSRTMKLSILYKLRYTDFPEKLEAPRNSSRQIGNPKQDSHRAPTNIRFNDTKFSRLGFVYSCVLQLFWRCRLSR